MNELFKCLSDPVRREILDVLKDGEKTVSQINEHFDVSQPTISYHLQILKDNDLVQVRKEKNQRYYVLKTSVLEDVISFMYNLKGGTNE